MDGKAGSEEELTPGERARENGANDDDEIVFNGSRRGVSGRRAELFVPACL
jgi:hypothetical protein